MAANAIKAVQKCQMELPTEFSLNSL